MTSPAPAAEAPERLPDFLIGGAMKAGTTTLHRLLARHPQVFLPDPEPRFFCLDDFTEQPDFFGPVGGRWIDHDFDRDLGPNLAWYRSLFRPARADQLVGERSTVYLPSARAPERVARMLPDVRMVFVLRDPVARTYAHYWHRVRWGQAVLGFEDTLRHAPHTLLTRSFYRRHLEAWTRHVPRERMHVVVFEELVADPLRAVREVCAFLGVAPPDDLGQAHHHAGTRPRSLTLQLLQNRLTRDVVARALLPALPRLPPPSRMAKLALKIDGGLRRLNQAPGTYPAMRRETRAFLGGLMARENAGLSALLGLDLEPHWPCLRGARG